MTVKELNNKLQAINLESLKQEAVKNKSELIEDLQRKQLRQGLRETGHKIAPKYSPSYGDYKGTLSTYFAPLGVPDLYLTGSFHKGIRMKLSGNDYTLGSDDEKSDTLEGKYGRIFGLNSTSLKQAQVAVMNEFYKILLKGL